MNNRLPIKSKAKKHAFIWIVLSVALLSSMGCYKQVFVDKTKRVDSEPTVEMWQKNLLFGLVAGPDIQMEEACPTGIGKVKESFTFPNGLTTALTFGLFSPYTIELYCAVPSRSQEKGNPAEGRAPSGVIDMGGLKPIPQNLMSPRKKEQGETP